MSGKGLDSKILGEVAVMVALAYVLNLIKIYHLPQGGSITLGSMVPVLLISYRRGPKIGVFTGIVFGLVQLALEGFIFHPVQVFLDYPLAFGVLGLAGYFRRQPIVGVVVALFARFLSHFISGVVYFGEFAPPEWGPILYSAIYNGSYLLPEMVISGVLIYLLVQRDVLNYME